MRVELNVGGGNIQAKRAEEEKKKRLKSARIVSVIYSREGGETCPQSLPAENILHNNSFLDWSNVKGPNFDWAESGYLMIQGPNSIFELVRNKIVVYLYSIQLEQRPCSIVPAPPGWNVETLHIDCHCIPIVDAH